ncbi:PREDICTED: coiled-coil domain-containing protein 93 isoform X1 [Papilio polytes]|uniref:coiled-coil domain-containing protein 93 isoform X1 n=2 Tax=Papilio polytes TaxID=76194 RepID=UPI000676AAD0|nr:PREDICTED: coiled-coil domain-containing protein 93 isoform X1 [Papilio polytes]
MATKQKNIFTRSKPLINIYSGLDEEGKKVEVREDAEQIVKWHEICDALVAAGYYRAQLQGLSAFDKIVGGLSWCIELCDIDVDISLLFEENLTIGKKIALTEKIVKILPTMKCPYIIEPHQIQGLDFINIYPLIQWLIKYSSEFREVKEDELRKFAVMQYDKDHIFESDRAYYLQKEKLLRNLSIVQDLYKPCRVRKRKGGFPTNELEQVNAVLSEYDQRMLMHVTNNQDDSKRDEGLDFLYDYEKTLADPSEVTTETDRNLKIEESDHVSADTKIHYVVLHSELTGDIPKELEESEKIKYSQDITTLTDSIDKMEKEVETIKKKHEQRMQDAKQQYTKTLSKLKKITQNLMKSDTYSDKNVKEFYGSLKDLAKERNELLKIIQHRDMQHKQLEEELRKAKDPKAEVEEQPLTPAELKEFHEREGKLKSFIASTRLELGKLNRQMLRYTVAIDEIPGTAELLQYEKRFVELYNQVASKHKETKQYFIFYNTLYEVKLYTSKELSLLNSILDNYEEAMSSARKREEFMTQFESIVDWVNQTVKKVEEKFNSEKARKTILHDEYTRLIDIQRQYAAALKKLAAERQKISRV